MTRLTRLRDVVTSVLEVSLLVVIAFTFPVKDASAEDERPQDRIVLRRPSAMVYTEDHLWVANRDTGSISVVDPDSGTVLNEIVVSARLDDLILIPGTQTLVAVDSELHQLVTLQLTLRDDAPDIEPSRTLRVAKYPVSLAASPNGAFVSCASKWSRRLTVIRSSELLSGHVSPAVIDLPFVPLRQCFLDDRYLLVADAHAGELAVVDAESGKLRSRQKLLGHNIRGLCLTENYPAASNGVTEPGVVISHQILNAASSTTRSTISWGGVISNTLHAIPVSELLKSSSVETPESVHGSLFPLGHEGQGAGDPCDVAFRRDGRAYIALRGVNEVAMRPPNSQRLTRVPIGRGPTELLLDENQSRLFVLSQFDDSVSMLNADSLTPARTIPLGKRPAVRSPTQAGEELFYDSRLSLDGWYSCHSCHSDGHTTGQLNDNLGDGSFGTPKRILTLLGTGKTKPWAWNGGLNDLGDQIRKSIELTMAGPGKHSAGISDQEIESLNFYLSSLLPAPSILAARDETVHPSVARGERVFKAHGCDRCHQPPGYTSPQSYDVGLPDQAGNTSFNPPSLLGVSQRGPYFHDNRASRLVDVLLEHDHDDASSLSETDVTDLLVFLKSL